MLWWSIIWKIISNPAYLAILILIALSSWLGVKGVYYRSQISSLKSDISIVEANYKTSKENVVSLKSALENVNGQISKYEGNITILTNQIVAEKDRVAYWRKMYTDKPCLNNDGEVVTPSSGRVLNDENSDKAVRNINSAFNAQ